MINISGQTECGFQLSILAISAFSCNSFLSSFKLRLKPTPSLFFFYNSCYGKALPVDSSRCRQMDKGAAEEAARAIQESKQSDVKIQFKLRFLNLFQGR